MLSREKESNIYYENIFVSFLSHRDIFPPRREKAEKEKGEKKENKGEKETNILYMIFSLSAKKNTAIITFI